MQTKHSIATPVPSAVAQAESDLRLVLSMCKDIGLPFLSIQHFQCVHFLCLVLPVYRHVSSVVLWRDMGCCAKTHDPLAVFRMNRLRRICGISAQDRVPSVDILSRCNTFFL